MRANVVFTLGDTPVSFQEMLQKLDANYTTCCSFIHDGVRLHHDGNRLDLSSEVYLEIESYEAELPKWLKGKSVTVTFVEQTTQHIPNGFYRYKKCTAEVNSYVVGAGYSSLEQTSIRIASERVPGAYEQAKKLFSLLRQGKLEELETLENWS